jgi:putative nucleotide binding protein
MPDFSRNEEREYKKSHMYEENAYVLDYLPYGRPGARSGFRAGALVQLVGENYFTLLEAIVKEGSTIKPYDRVYVGKEPRGEITYILGRIGYEELSTNAKLELPLVIEKVVNNREKWFVNFFNTTQPITPRMHALELIPGIGKKYMWQVLNEREKKPFKDFSDLQQRASIPSPQKLIAKRVLEELEGESKYRLFTRPP